MELPTDQTEEQLAELDTGDKDETDIGSSLLEGTSTWMKKNLLCYNEVKDTSVAYIPVEKYSRYYNMDHKHRGVAVILNHENFESLNLEKRIGTHVDKENLDKTLKKLGFSVKSYDDLKYEKVIKVLKDVSRMDHSNNDCFLLVCLTHGKEGLLSSYDQPYLADTLWHRFTADKCPTLAGKPKLFFVQACQGKKSDGGVTLHWPVETDSGPINYKIPTHSDFLIHFSTVPGFYSRRKEVRGSWFIEALCERLNEFAYKEDLMTLLTFVNQKVALDYESFHPEEPEMSGKKQMPCITTTLIRLIQFEEKNNTKDS